MSKRPNRRTVALKCVMNHKLSDTVWAVLMALASHIGPDGDCFPSIETIGREANGRSASTVKRAINDAVKLGLLRKYRKTVNGRSMVHYTITPIAVELRFDKSKQSWSAFVLQNTRYDKILPGETRKQFVGRISSRREVHYET